MHENRVKADTEMQLLFERIAKSKRIRDNNAISLNETDRRAERKEQDALLPSKKPINHASSSISDEATDEARDDGLQPDERSIAKANSSDKARKSAKDVLLLEAVHVLSDAVTLTSINSQLAESNALATAPATP
jgi:carboxyl-terminal processing protease